MNPYECAARQRKALRIAAALVEAECDADAAERLDWRGRLAAAAVAGVKPPSDETWALVVEEMRFRERARFVPADPFAGFPR